MAETLISRAAVMAAWRRAQPTLDVGRESALNRLLGFVETDRDLLDVRHVAYLLATVRHETAGTYEPIEEFASGEAYEGRDDLGNVVPGDGVRYKGRGYVQVTGRRNYSLFGLRLGVPLVEHPDLALDPSVSYRIASLGMRQGLFTGARLSRYIAGARCDYVNARRIINGLDRAERIAGYAEQFEHMIREADGGKA